MFFYKYSHTIYYLPIESMEMSAVCRCVPEHLFISFYLARLLLNEIELWPNGNFPRHKALSESVKSS